MEVVEQTPDTLEAPGEDEQPGDDEQPTDPDELTEEGELESDDNPDAPQAGAGEQLEASQPEELEQPQPPLPGARSEAEVEETFKKLGRSATTWRNRVSELLGEDAQGLVACELCHPEIPGFHFPAELTEPDSELHARLLAVLVTPSAPDYVPSPAHRRCDNCDGWGKVVTGSRVAGKDTATCPTCSGYGFVPPPGAQSMTAAAAGDAAAAFVPAEEPAALEDTDPWGSPRILADGSENPNYGRMPQYKTAGVP